MTKLVSDREVENLEGDKTKLERLIGYYADTFGAFGLPTSSLQRKLREAFERRHHTARELLIEEIGKGSVAVDLDSLAAMDEFVAVTLRYQRAIDNGAKIRNLRLLAKIFAAQLQSGSVDQDSFFQKSAALEELTEVEITFLGSWLAFDPDTNSSKFFESPALKEIDPSELSSIAASLQRTGLVEVKSGWGGGGYGLTPLAKRLLNELTISDLKCG